MAPKPNYRVVGSHAETLADGSLHEPETEVHLTQSELSKPHNKMLIEDGKLIPLDEPKKGKEG